MMRQFYFLGGLPRAGSTLLCNILAQNPRLHCTHTSGCMDVMFIVRNHWNKLIEHKAHPDEEALRRVLRGILCSYYESVEKPVVVDKCRGWVSLIEMAEFALERKLKVIVPVRDVRNVLASFERLWRESAATSQTPGESENYFQFQTAEGRAEFWLRDNQPVGLAVNRIRDAVRRGYRDRMHFVRFEALTTSSKKTAAALYEFLGEQPFEHDFEHVDQVTWEDDTVHGFKGLHEIRPKVEPVPPQWQTVPGEFASKYASMNQIWES
jgi:sulfotransferase